ncbi:MAG: large conductance mechanosensitive channel protein MscL [Actinomycetales bacterium]|nr:large conductance mechanosensitive channel protein MscL [Actinomycetales bacterium]
MLNGFKEFIFRGNIIDLATAVVIGTAFTALVTAITKSLIEPIINAFAGPNAVSGLGFRLLKDNPATYIDLAAVINALITFTIIAAVVYFLVIVPMKAVSERMAKAEEAEPEADAEEIVLLREIRDALAQQNG